MKISTCVGQSIPHP